MPDFAPEALRSLISLWGTATEEHKNFGSEAHHESHSMLCGVFYLFSGVSIPPRQAWISNYSLSTYFNYHTTDGATMTWDWAVVYLWSGGARFAHGAGDTLVFIQKQRSKPLILLDTSVSLLVVINVRYVRAAPSVQETLSLQDLPQCPVNTSATEIKTECATQPPEQNLMTLGFFLLFSNPRLKEDVAVVKEHRIVYGDGTRVHNTAASLLFTALKLNFHLHAARKWL